MARWLPTPITRGTLADANPDHDHEPNPDRDHEPNPDHDHEPNPGPKLSRNPNPNLNPDPILHPNSLSLTLNLVIVVVSERPGENHFSLN